MIEIFRSMNTENEVGHKYKSNFMLFLTKFENLITELSHCMIKLTDLYYLLSIYKEERLCGFQAKNILVLL